MTTTEAKPTPDPGASPAAILEIPGCVFSVVQYVPGTLGYDRYAIGIIAIDQMTGRMHCAFIADWRRATTFGDTSGDFLREFAEEMRARPDLTRHELDEMVHDYQNLLQLTEPDYASVGAEEWVRDFGPLFVRDLGRTVVRRGRLPGVVTRE